MWHQQLSKGKWRGLSVRVLVCWARLITQSLPHWQFRVRLTSQKALGYEDNWLINQTLPKCLPTAKRWSGRLSVLPPCPHFAPLPPDTIMLLFPPILSCPSEMAAHQWLQPLTVAALCWDEGNTGRGRCWALPGNQPYSRPSPVCG